MNDVRREKYRVMPALPAEDYEALAAARTASCISRASLLTSPGGRPGPALRLLAGAFSS